MVEPDSCRIIQLEDEPVSFGGPHKREPNELPNMIPEARLAGSPATGPPRTRDRSSSSCRSPVFGGARLLLGASLTARQRRGGQRPTRFDLGATRHVVPYLSPFSSFVRSQLSCSASLPTRSHTYRGLRLHVVPRHRRLTDRGLRGLCSRRRFTGTMARTYTPALVYSDGRCRPEDVDYPLKLA